MAPTSRPTGRLSDELRHHTASMDAKQEQGADTVHAGRGAAAEGHGARQGQLRLVLWKNAVLKRRHWMGSLVELLIPLGAMLLMTYFRHLDRPKPVATQLTPVPAFDARLAAQPLVENCMCGSELLRSGRVSGSARLGLAPATPAEAPDVLALRDALRDTFVPLVQQSPPYCVSTSEAVAYVRDYDAGLFRVFDSVAQMEAFIQSAEYALSDEPADRPLLAGLTLGPFDNTTARFVYEFRANVSDVPATTLKVNKFITDFDLTDYTAYFTNGFTVFANVLDSLLLAKATGGSGGPGISVQLAPFPVAAGRVSTFEDAVSPVFGLYMVLAFMWPFSRLVRHIVDEKERRLKEGMMMMGLRNSVFWWSWALTYLLIFGLVAVLGAFILSINLFSYANLALVVLLYLLYAVSLICLGLLVSTFFDRAKTAGTLSNFLLIIIYIPFVAVSSPNRGEAGKLGACLLSPVAFSLANLQLLQYEKAFIGVQWDNVEEITNNFQFVWGLVFLAGDCALYLLLAWYFDRVLPKEYGTHLPWHFPFHASYWRGSDDWDASPSRRFAVVPHVGESQVLTDPLLESGEHAEGGRDGEGDGDKVRYEPVPPELRDRVGVRIRSLRKAFGEMVAVSGLTLDLYRGQIFVLLGKNGAGKTTTVNMLTGMVPITSGGAEIEGLDVRSQMDAVRQILGVCPQYDILWDDLTVAEHLRFFAALKGVRPEQVESHVQESLREVGLIAQADQLSRTLSGGQKRRLSLAIAFSGDSRIVFLDEPTSGVDAASRRAIWDLLARKKQGRLIILTTHFMDEADQLGDRIAILHRGALRCVGSALFLKQSYGAGYTMTVTKQPHAASDALSRLVTNTVPQAKLLTDIGAEVSFQLPLDATARFPDLLRTLDVRKGELGVEYYGLSVTTLEEVFLKVSEGAADAAEIAQIRERMRRNSSAADDGGHARAGESSLMAAASGGRSRGRGGSEDVEFEELADMEEPSTLLSASEKNRSFGRDMRALMEKRFHILKRDRRAGCCQFLAPVLLLTAGLAFMQFPISLLLRPVELDAATQYGAPVELPFNSLPDTGGSTLIAQMAAESVSGQALNASSVVQLAQGILDTRLSSRARFGAMLVSNISAAAPAVTVLSNLTGVHSMAVFMNLADKALLRQLSGRPQADISVTVRPWPLTRQQKDTVNSINGVTAAIVVALALSFVPTAFVVHVVKDREQNSKLLQRISGVNMYTYWLASFAWDYANFLVCAGVCSLILLAFNNPVYVGANFAAVLASWALYGLSVIPFTYAMSFIFSSHSNAQNVMIAVYLAGGIVLTITSFVLYTIPSTQEANDKYIRHLFRLSPNFCMADSMFWLSVRALPGVGLSRWDMNVTGYDLVFMAVESVAYILLTLLLEYVSSEPKLLSLFQRDPQLPYSQLPEDEDVAAERRRIESGASVGDMVTLFGLRKTYPPALVAVDRLFFSVPAGQCFGYLGVNGAGKTTTLKILTGDVLPTAGAATIGGLDIVQHPRRVRQLLGYCPQFDALYEHLSAQETLEFFGRIRGVPESKLKRMVGYLIDRLTLTEYAQRPAGTYSGGNKRKLSVAIALVGDPAVVFLDEPSTGMDPVSRRFMWDFITETMARRSVVLTTHSMEECEALCQRIGILAHGRMLCVGSSQHLKHRFGRGFQLSISTADRSMENARRFVLSTFEGAVETEQHGGHLKFQVPPQRIALADMFSLIEARKTELGIAAYSLGQTSLEQIFINFARIGESQYNAEHAHRPH